MRRKIVLPLTAIPVLLVTGASLLVLLAGVAGAAGNGRPASAQYAPQSAAAQAQVVLTDVPALRGDLQGSVHVAQPARPLIGAGGALTQSSAQTSAAASAWVVVGWLLAAVTALGIAPQVVRQAVTVRARNRRR